MEQLGSCYHLRYLTGLSFFSLFKVNTMKKKKQFVMLLQKPKSAKSSVLKTFFRRISLLLHSGDTGDSFQKC